MKIYLAGPLFSSAERAFNSSLAWKLRDYGYVVWLPQENEPRLGIPNWEKEVFTLDVRGIDEADVVVANMDGPDPDSGTAWEHGYAFGKGKPVVAFRTDFRSASDGSVPFNIMLSQSAAIVLIQPMATIADLATRIDSALKNLPQEHINVPCC